MRERGEMRRRKRVEGDQRRRILPINTLGCLAG